MLPQRTPFPVDSSLRSVYPYFFGPSTQNFNQLLPRARQMNNVYAFYDSLFHQDTQRMLETLCYQNQKENYLSNQLWQNLAASLTDSNFKTPLGGSSCKDSESQLQIPSNASKTRNVSVEAATASLNKNLEFSSLKKAKQVSFTKCQKVVNTTKVTSNGGNDRNIHHVICKIEAEGESNKRIKTNDQESRNQIGLHSPNSDSFIRPLDPNDCAFDSNDESDSENIEWFLAENDCMSSMTKEQQQEGPKQKIFISPENKVDVADTKTRECPIKLENVKTEFDCQQLLENELEALNSSFSSDDWPSLSEDVEFQILQQDQF